MTGPPPSSESGGLPVPRDQYESALAEQANPDEEDFNEDAYRFSIYVLEEASFYGVTDA